MMHEHALENFDFFLQNEIILKFTEFDISSVPTKTTQIGIYPFNVFLFKI